MEWKMKLPSQKTTATFALGAATVLFAQSKLARKLAVKGTVKALRLKDEAFRAVENIREEACDIYEESRRDEDCGCCQASCEDEKQ